MFTAGRLWIHAAAKEPTEQEVKSLQDFYRVHLKSMPKNLHFQSVSFFVCKCVSEVGLRFQRRRIHDYP